MRIVRRLSLALIFGLLLASASEASAASIWTPINSNTTDTISAIVYQSPTRMWYATTNGRIAYFDGSSFVAGAGVPAGENFTDLAFQPGNVPGGPGTAGSYGYAVTSSGHLWQTSNGGISWTQLATPSTVADCSVGSPASPVAELNAVVWANSSTAYLLGDNSTLQKSTAANTPTPAFTEINKVGTGTCQAQSQSFTENLADATFLPSNSIDGFMVDQSFGGLYATSSGFASGAKAGETVNNFTGNPRIAQDAANPNRLWVVDHKAGGAGCDELCLQLSIDGGTTSTHATFPNDPSPTVGLYDISSRGGTEVTAGSEGEIFNSIDGSKFYLQRAGGTLATENWRAEDGYDAAHAAVGGEGGALAVTASANTLPGSGNQPPSGQHPVTTSTGGATITVYKIVIVTGRKGRFVPATFASKHPRKFLMTVLTAKARHRVRATKLTLKHGGRKTIHLSLSKSVKPGKYLISVQVFSAKGHRLGRKITLAFVLR